MIWIDTTYCSYTQINSVTNYTSNLGDSKEVRELKLGVKSKELGMRERKAESRVEGSKLGVRSEE